MNQIKPSWSDIVRSGHIKKQNAWYYFQSTVKKLLEFSLISTSNNDKQCHHIESPAFFYAIQSSGISSNMQRDIVGQPLVYLVPNNRTIYGTQGLKNIMAVLNFDKNDSISVKELSASLESTKLEVGYSVPLFTNNYPILSNHITNSITRKQLRYSL